LRVNIACLLLLVVVVGLCACVCYVFYERVMLINALPLPIARDFAFDFPFLPLLFLGTPSRNPATTPHTHRQLAGLLLLWGPWLGLAAYGLRRELPHQPSFGRPPCLIPELAPLCLCAFSPSPLHYTTTTTHLFTALYALWPPLVLVVLADGAPGAREACLPHLLRAPHTRSIIKPLSHTLTHTLIHAHTPHTGRGSRCRGWVSLSLSLEKRERRRRKRAGFDSICPLPLLLFFLVAFPFSTIQPAKKKMKK